MQRPPPPGTFAYDEADKIARSSTWTRLLLLSCLDFLMR